MPFAPPNAGQEEDEIDFWFSTRRTSQQLREAIEHQVDYAMHWGGANGWAGEGPCGMTAYFGRWAFALEGPWRILRSSRTVEMGIGTRGGSKLTKK